MYIEIAGSLATGKTTLAKLMAAHGFHYLAENFEGNPYLARAVEEPDKYLVDSQKWFVASKIKAVFEAVSNPANRQVVTDFSMYTDRGYIDYYLRNKEPSVMRDLFRQLDQSIKKAGKPAAIIHLYCDLDTQMERIRARGRNFEQSCSRDFVQAIDQLVEHYAKQATIEDGVPVIKIDTSKVDFEKEPEKLIQILKTIQSKALTQKYRYIP